MERQRYQLITHTFVGRRFDDSGLDLSVLQELVTYREILAETAKEIWRRRNPDRRLPRSFEASLSVKFYALEPGSVRVPLYREIQSGPLPVPVDRSPDELDEAVILTAEAIAAVSADRALPASLPKKIVAMFVDYGRTLLADEYIEYSLPGRDDLKPCFSPRERNRFAELADPSYEDLVDLLGEVRAADLDGANFVMRLEDGTKVPGRFPRDREETIVNALSEHYSQRLRIRGRAQFSPDKKLKKIISIDDVTASSGQQPYDQSAQPIWKIAEDIAATVPADEWDKLPTDVSRNLDHYLH